MSLSEYKVAASIAVSDIAHAREFERGAKVAYFREPDGNMLSVAQAGRS